MAPASFSVARQVPPPVEGRVPRQYCGLWQVLRHGGGGGGPKFLSGGETFIESRSLLCQSLLCQSLLCRSFRAALFVPLFLCRSDVHTKHFLHEVGSTFLCGMLAYLLVREHGYTIPQALYSIVYPVGVDIRGVETTLTQRGYHAPRNQYKKRIGIYSAQKNRGVGGYKCHAEKYFHFTNSVIDAMEDALSSSK